jgi:autoinducer 2-degrading protein
MLAIVVNFEIHPDTETQAIAALEANAAGSRTEPGCLKWEWSRHVDEPNQFAIYELYLDQAAIDSHKSSEHFEAWDESIPSFMKEKSAGIFEVTGVDTRPVPWK